MARFRCAGNGHGSGLSEIPVSRGKKVPTYIPKANEFAEKFAKLPEALR